MKLLKFAVIGAVIAVPEGGAVKKGQSFVKWDPYSVPILSEQSGVIEFHDFIEGVTVRKVIVVKDRIVNIVAN